MVFVENMYRRRMCRSSGKLFPVYVSSRRCYHNEPSLACSSRYDHQHPSSARMIPCLLIHSYNFRKELYCNSHFSFFPHFVSRRWSAHCMAVRSVFRGLSSGLSVSDIIQVMYYSNTDFKVQVMRYEI